MDEKPKRVYKTRREMRDEIRAKVQADAGKPLVTCKTQVGGEGVANLPVSVPVIGSHPHVIPAENAITVESQPVAHSDALDWAVVIGPCFNRFKVYVMWQGKKADALLPQKVDFLAPRTKVRVVEGPMGQLEIVGRYAKRGGGYVEGSYTPKPRDVVITPSCDMRLWLRGDGGISAKIGPITDTQLGEAMAFLNFGPKEPSP